MKKAIILCLSIILSISLLGTLVCLYIKHIQTSDAVAEAVENDSVIYPIVESLDDIEETIDEVVDVVEEEIEEVVEKERVPLFNISIDRETAVDSENTDSYYEADKTDYSQNIRFEAIENVTQVKILGLSAECISEDGEITFEYEPIFEYGDMKAGEALFVSMELPEVIPLYAISYVGDDGYIYYDSVNQSGEDGSVYLSTYEVHPLDDEQTD